MAETFFQLLERERIHRQIYPARDQARADVFNSIVMFYNLSVATTAICSELSPKVVRIFLIRS